MRKYGLIGYPLSHSFSPGYFSGKFREEKIFDASYKAYPLENIDELSSLLLKGIQGLNVTIPYKQDVMNYLDEISEEALEVGAVNTIKIIGSKKIGFNTDVFGFGQSLSNTLESKLPGFALVLGTGGASKAVCYALKKLGVGYQLVSRNPAPGVITYEDLSESTLNESQLIVNTTPLGMYPRVEYCPQIPYDYLTPNHFLFDLVYNPEKTLFLKKGEQRGCLIKNGHEMLILQAEKSWLIWNQS